MRIMFWHQAVAKSLPESLMAKFLDDTWRDWAAMSSVDCCTHVRFSVVFIFILFVSLFLFY